MDKCETCGQEKVYDHEFEEVSCSEFCAVADEDDKRLARNLKPGDWGLWPCPLCGDVIEDEYSPSVICIRCVPRKRLMNTVREAVELLKSIIPYVGESQYDQKVREFVKKHGEQDGPDPKGA